MSLYAAQPRRRTAQVVADILFLLWVVGWVWVGLEVHATTSSLGDRGRDLDGAATGLAEGLTGAGDVLENVPVVGEEARAPLDEAADASSQVASAGRDSAESLDRLAFSLGLSIAAIPITVIAVVYVPRRWRFVRESAAGAALRGDDEVDLYALRALLRQPVDVLAGISDDPAGAWRDRDPETLRRLADLERRATGVRGRG
jgi:hypothetical protein